MVLAWIDRCLLVIVTIEGRVGEVVVKEWYLLDTYEVLTLLFKLKYVAKKYQGRDKVEISEADVALVRRRGAKWIGGH
jgi:hypothetical protein